MKNHVSTTPYFLPHTILSRMTHPFLSAREGSAVLQQSLTPPALFEMITGQIGLDAFKRNLERVCATPECVYACAGHASLGSATAVQARVIMHQK